MNYAEIIREHLSGIINEGGWKGRDFTFTKVVMCVTSYKDIDMILLLSLGVSNFMTWPPTYKSFIVMSANLMNPFSLLN